MNTRQIQNVNQKVILKRIENFTILEFTINWIIFIIQEYLKHSWFFFIIVQQYIKYHRILYIQYQILSKFTSQAIQNKQFPIISYQCNYSFQTNRSKAFLLILLLINIIVYGIQFKLILLFLQIPILLLKIKLRSLAIIGHQDRHQHIQLETQHNQ
ncbi:unnamed protein product [Paramecium pentaurelia]|uniref:Transmembrane protein n=1 Tax=Paramecium pentaurelia TaxID=43138 RepID=A0A8S1S253_9CILI|nr:unnamed protein product [Paramecium pentaurelia]